MSITSDKWSGLGDVPLCSVELHFWIKQHDRALMYGILVHTQ